MMFPHENFNFLKEQILVTKKNYYFVNIKSLGVLLVLNLFQLNIQQIREHG